VGREAGQELHRHPEGPLVLAVGDEAGESAHVLEFVENLNLMREKRGCVRGRINRREIGLDGRGGQILEQKKSVLTWLDDESATPRLSSL